MGCCPARYFPRPASVKAIITKVEYILAAQVLTFERYYSQRENIVKNYPV